MTAASGLITLTVLGIGALLVTLAFNLITGWELDAVCPGSAAFCAGPWWTAVAQYLPVWLFLGQLAVVGVFASPYAMARV